MHRVRFPVPGRWRDSGENLSVDTSRHRLKVLLLTLALAGLGLLLVLELKGLNEKLVDDSQVTETVIRASVTEVARLAFLSGDVHTIVPYLRELTRGPAVAGVVVADAQGRIVANVWQGEESDQVDVVRNTMPGSRESSTIEDGGRRLGSASILAEQQHPPVVQREVTRLLVLFMVAFASVALASAWIVRKILDKRTQRICEATDMFAHGDYSVRIPATGTDPMARLSGSFNRMAYELDHHIRRLRSSEERFELAVNGSNECVWDWNIANDRLYLSPRFTDILGYDNDELPDLFIAFRRWIHPEDKLAFEYALQRHLVRDVAFRCELRLRAKSGTWVWMLARGRAVKSSPGTPVRMAGSFSDISPQKAAQRALGEEKERAETTLRSIVDGVITTDARGAIRYMNPTAEKLTARDCEDARGSQLFEVLDILAADGKPIDWGIADRVLETGEAESLVNRHILKNRLGKAYLIKGTVAPLRDEVDQIAGMVITFHNITTRMKLLDALDRQTEHALVTLNAIGDAVVTTDEDNRVTYMNPAAERLTGCGCEEVRDWPFVQVIAFDRETGDEEIADPVNVLRRNGGSVLDLGERKLRTRHGEEYTVEHQIAPLRSKTQKIVGSVVVLHNVSDRHKLMAELSYQARHDALTQLINRYEFERQLARVVGHADAEHVVCYLDLDQFKIVNDSCGHRAGDELLRQVADLFQEHIRHSDTIARLGGDEFGLLLESCSLQNAEKIAETLRNEVEALRFCWDEKYFSLSVSIGLYLIEGGAVSPQQVLSAVDEACYIAKRKGRNRIHVHRSDDVETHRFHREIEAIPDIHKAIDENRFLLFAQPITPLDGRGESLHYEFLLRMRDRRGRILEPGSFLPAAERYGLMPLLDRWVVDAAVAGLAKGLTSDNACPIDTVGINISAAVLNDHGFLDHVKMAMKRHSVLPTVLCFEITETLAIANFTSARRFIDELKEMGCRFALDDFGSGFASFSNLRALPVDYLKIDGSFVRRMMREKVDFAMVEVINEIGHIMGLKTIAEFVESSDTLEALKGMGVDYAQGYHLGRPVPLSHIFGDATPIELAAG